MRTNSKWTLPHAPLLFLGLQSQITASPHPSTGDLLSRCRLLLVGSPTFTYLRSAAALIFLSLAKTATPLPSLNDVTVEKLPRM